jgi:hypothetical protein
LDVVSYRKYTELALKRLHKSLPELRIGHDFLFVTPVDHVVRGFILETTPEIKGTAYFWRVVMALYRSSGLLVLNYGERLLGGERLSLLEPELGRTIDRLVKTVHGDELACLKAIQAPKDFLRQVDWGTLPQTPNYQIDLALTHYMAGTLRRAKTYWIGRPADRRDRDGQKRSAWLRSWHTNCGRIRLLFRRELRPGSKLR